MIIFVWYLVMWVNWWLFVILLMVKIFLLVVCNWVLMVMLCGVVLMFVVFKFKFLVFGLCLVVIKRWDFLIVFLLDDLFIEIWILLFEDCFIFLILVCLSKVMFFFFIVFKVIVESLGLFLFSIWEVLIIVIEVFNWWWVWVIFMLIGLLLIMIKWFGNVWFKKSVLLVR